MIGLRLLAAWPHTRAANMRSIAAIMAKGLCFGLVVASLASRGATAADDAAQISAMPGPSLAPERVVAAFAIEPDAMMVHHPKWANFDLERASHDARQNADWVVDSGDNHSMPFAIVDKTDAKVFVFDAHGQLRGAAPALLGLALGDDAVPGIGDRALSSIRREERTTPAGRFVSALGRNSHGKEILWVDYDGAVSMHPVVTTNPAERRLQRLATPTPLDNRISYGCINVPAKFFENVVRPAFTGTYGIVYVLPETRSAREVFKSYDVDEHARAKAASQPTPAGVASEAAQH
jgi:hypothetical protein